MNENKLTNNKKQNTQLCGTLQILSVQNYYYYFFFKN